MDKIKVETRENRHGRYWCNATINGYDHFEEAATPEAARELFKQERNLTDEDIEWLPVKPYPHQEKVIDNPYLIRAQKVRLDHNPQG